MRPHISSKDYCRVRSRWLVLIFTLSLALIIGCRSQTDQRHTLTIAGSTSVQPFAEKLAEIYMQEHPDLLINVQGGGSSAGILAVEQGAADIGTSSRDLTPEEKHLNDIAIAWDGIAIIVHPSCPLENLSLEKLRQIFTGQIQNWRQLGLEPHGIHAITREEGSGTRNAFEELVMGQAEITPAALVQDSNGSVREIVANDPYALGYISVGLVNDRVKALAIDGVKPSSINIKEKRYKLIRRFYFVTRDTPSRTAKNFIDYVLSRKGQLLLEVEGLVSVH
ncbi:MAG: phosphate ABC transporter substrate-binding protein [Deltaproteobacteria bacterium]|nr:phosphate ABC transporter substrate-binding protein [Deltaproteobacteria bacterium]MBW2134626.1 phosphate ABC transporter substrate-binding protein [Deltaproteobacteria bacterium]